MKRISVALFFLSLGLGAAGAPAEPCLYRDNFPGSVRIEQRIAGNVRDGGYCRNGVLSYDFHTPGQAAALIRKKAGVPLTRDSLLTLRLLSDGRRQRIFLLLEDRSGETFLLDGGRCLKEGYRNLVFPLADFFAPSDAVTGEIWGGDGNRLFDPPLTGIAVGIDNYPDGVRRKGRIKLEYLEISTAGPEAGAVPPGEADKPGPKQPLAGWSATRGVLSAGAGSDGQAARLVMNRGRDERRGAFISREIDIPGGLRKGDIWFFSGRIRVEKPVRIGVVISDSPQGPTYSEPISCTLFPGDGWLDFLVPYQVPSSVNARLKPHIYVYEPEKPVLIEDVRVYRAPDGAVLSPEYLGRYVTQGVIVPDAYEQ